MSALGECVKENKCGQTDNSSAPMSKGGIESQFRKMQYCHSTSTDWGNSTEGGSVDGETNDHAADTAIKRSFCQSRSKRRMKKLSSASSGDSGIFGGVSITEFRVLILGPNKVGKTKIVESVTGKSQNKPNQKTLQDFYFVNVESSKFGRFSLILEDTGGYFLSEFPSMAEISLNMADGIVLVYSLDNPASFEDISSMRDNIILR